MGTSETDSAPGDAAAALSAVADAVASLSEDFRRMPFFVRPMAQKGFEKRTGRSPEAWCRPVADAARALASGGADALARWPGLETDLGRLAENFRGAPERAGRMMRGEALERLREASAGREARVREALAALGRLRSRQ